MPGELSAAVQGKKQSAWLHACLLVCMCGCLPSAPDDCHLHCSQSMHALQFPTRYSDGRTSPYQCSSPPQRHISSGIPAACAHASPPCHLHFRPFGPPLLQEDAAPVDHSARCSSETCAECSTPCGCYDQGPYSFCSRVSMASCTSFAACSV